MAIQKLPAGDRTRSRVHRGKRRKTLRHLHSRRPNACAAMQRYPTSACWVTVDHLPSVWGTGVSCSSPSGLARVINPYYVEFRQSRGVASLPISGSFAAVADTAIHPDRARCSWIGHQVRVAERQSTKASRSLSLGAQAFVVLGNGCKGPVTGWHHVRGAVGYSSIKSAALCSHPDHETQRYCPSLFQIRPCASPSRSIHSVSLFQIPILHARPTLTSSRENGGH